MKRALFFLLIATFASSDLFSQNNENHFNAGLGLSGWGIPIYASYDWGFRRDFNLGVGASLATGSDGRNGRPDGEAFGAGFFTQWYADRVLEIPSEFDAYAGLGVFYYTYGGGDDLDLNLFIGGRYFFNNTLGVNLEFGGGSAFSGGKVGLSWRL